MSSSRLSLSRRPPVPAAMTFPILSPEDIVQSLGESGIRLEVDDLVKSREGPLRAACEQLLLQLLHSKDELYQPKFSGLNALEGSLELHTESVVVIHFVRSMNKLCLAAGVSEGFSLKDLMKPDMKRVLRMLSGIINLAKFRESVQPDYDAHTKKTVRRWGVVRWGLRMSTPLPPLTCPPPPHSRRICCTKSSARMRRQTR